jgi:hypothetical protein
MVLHFSLPCSREKYIQKFLLASLNTLTIIIIQKIVPKASSEFMFRLSFSLSDFIQCVHVMAGFRNNFQDHRRLAEKRVIGGYQKAGTSFLKRVTGRIFTISK